MTVVNPPPPPPPAGPTILQLTPAAEDAATAQALAWGNGIPDAEVTLTPTDSSAAPRSARSSASGRVDLGIVGPGTYLVEAKRWLTADEPARLPPEQDVDGWAVRTKMSGEGAADQTHILPAIVREFQGRGLEVGNHDVTIGEAKRASHPPERGRAGRVLSPNYEGSWLH